MSRAVDPLASRHPLRVPSDQLARQATASLGGHLFQATRAATEWSHLGEDAQLLIEVAEDYALLVRDALEMTQTKHEFGASVTLRSDGVRKALSGLIAFQEANPDLRVSLAYLTTAQPGREIGSGIPNGATGLSYWLEASRGADLASLRQLLLDTQLDERVLDFVRESDDDALRGRLIQRVSWLTGSPALPAAQAVLQARLRALAVERTGYAEDGDRALPFILNRVLHTAIAEDRVLTREDFEDEWQRATTIGVSFSMVRQFAVLGGAGDGVPFAAEPPPPTLSARTAPRRALVDRLRGDLRTADVLWLHGSSGLGKSQLTRLISAGANGRWEFVALGDCTPEQQEARVRAAVARIDREGFAGLILDDLPVPAPEGLRRWIAAASLELSSVSGARVIVTSERELLPAVRMAFEPLRIVVRNAPYLERDDVEHMVVAAGGVAGDWAALIHLTCGGGHPLLVDARVAGLASKGWPAGERLNGLGLGEGATEIEDVRREVSLRLLDELSPDTHRLLFRLSGLVGNFDRRLVDAVASIIPAIPSAGALLHYLVGPWIEQKFEDRFGLSPLLAASATSLSASERERVLNAAIEDLIRRNPFPGDLLSALIVYSMIVRHAGGFMFVARAVLATEKRFRLASELFPLVYMKSGKGGLLFPESPGVSVMLRLAQVMAAVNDDSARMVEQVVAEALAEVAGHPEPLRGGNTFMILIAVLGNESADLRPNVWMPMLVSYRDHLIAGHFPREMTELMDDVDLGGLTPDRMFFVVRSNKVDTVADVEELFGELDEVNPTWRHELLTGATHLLKGPPLFVQKGWSSETSPSTLDAAAAEAAYTRMADQAVRWGEVEIAVECVRSRVVMLDEYLDRHEDALSVLDDADAKFGKNERLIRSRAAVLATVGRHAEELELLSGLSSDYSQDEPLERLMMLRTAAISAARLGRFGRSAELFHQAYELASAEPPEVLAASVRPGLLADAAAMEVRDGRPADAIVDLLGALDDVTDGGPADDTSAFALSAITHVTQWAAASIEGRAFPEDPSANPGVCSTLQPKFDPAQMEARKPNQELYLLTRLEGIADVAVGVERRLLERERVDGVQLKLAVGVAATQMERNIGKGDATAVLDLLPRYAWLSGLLVRAGGADGVHPGSEMIEPVQWQEAEQLAARAAVSGVVGMLFANGRPDEAVRAAKRAGQLSPGLGSLITEVNPSNESEPEFFQIGIAALRLLQSGVEMNAEQLLRASVELFMWLRHVSSSALCEKAHAVLAGSWLEMVRERRVLLSTPRLAVPAIEAAASTTPGIGGIARIVEAGRLGSSLGLPPHVVEMLQSVK
ncbi:hypothetical protein NS277_13440 [Novosphingobium barchaimii]|nr:hypothetical protein NS277_13440 [Novosphingobium barchaimii]